MDVAYLSVYYTADCTKDVARFHDWIHALREMDQPPFDAKVHTYVVWKQDELVYSEPPHYLDAAESLYPSAKNQPEGILNVPRIRRDLQEHDPDVIHAVSINLPILLVLKSIDIDAELVIGPSIGGWNPVRPDELWLDDLKDRFNYKLGYKLNNSYLKFLEATKFVSFTKYHKKMLATYGISEADIIPLKPGVHPLFQPDGPDEAENDSIELLFVGWFDSGHKGYELFLRALAQVDDQVSARIIGRGDPQLKLIEELGLGERVTIEGFKPRSELQRIYNSCDITIVPSTDETGGTNTKFESLACGTPVVATDEEGINESAHPDSVIYFSPREPDVLAEAITQALDDFPKLTRSAETHADDHSAATTVDQLSEIYNNL